MSTFSLEEDVSGVDAFIPTRYLTGSRSHTPDGRPWSREGWYSMESSLGSVPCFINPFMSKQFCWPIKAMRMRPAFLTAGDGVDGRVCHCFPGHPVMARQV